MREALWEPRSQLAPGPRGVWRWLSGQCQDRTKLLVTWSASKMRCAGQTQLSRTRAGSGSQKAEQLRWTPQSCSTEAPTWPTSTLVTWPTGSEKPAVRWLRWLQGSRLARCAPVHRTIPGAQDSAFSSQGPSVLGPKLHTYCPSKRVREPNSSPGSEQWRLVMERGVSYLLSDFKKIWTIFLRMMKT